MSMVTNYFYYLFVTHLQNLLVKFMFKVFTWTSLPNLFFSAIFTLVSDFSL